VVQGIVDRALRLRAPGENKSAPDEVREFG
jgi:hypothetical protein